jgi:2-oxoglutarate dehydrogenase E1 component
MLCCGRTGLKGDAMSDWSDFHGLNLAYVADLYERYRNNPDALDPALRASVEQLAEPDRPSRSVGNADLAAVVGAVNLAEAIRKYGHLGAQLDPLGRPPAGDPSLDPQAHGITEEDLHRLPASLVGGPLARTGETALDAIRALRRVYCSTTGYDYAHIFVPAEREWLRDAAEAGTFELADDPVDELELLDRLTQVEAFERFLHRAFPGKTRFSLEGLDMLVPVLDEVIASAAQSGTRNILIGMAHRGRLNVLAHVLQKPYAQILAEFRDELQPRAFREDMSWTGDVKYHAGFRREVDKDKDRQGLTITMPPNPSHLEAVNPVVEGMARAAGTRADHPGAPIFDPALTLPILIHGDAAFPGQGVVAETLNLSRLKGYTTGGTIHIITNNQLGFTTTPQEAYSTSYPSGLARGFKIPTVHVNADDPEACIAAARLAWSYRARFHLDFLIDLVGYRRYGHNEGDEPSFTQPMMYQRIAKHPPVREVWAQELESRGLVDRETAEGLLRKHLDVLEQALAALRLGADLVEPVPAVPPPGAARAVETAVSVDRLRGLNDRVLSRPEGFAEHRKLTRIRERRQSNFDDVDRPTIDWPAAEELAFASILEDGIAIRLTGQDVARGTFSQRHAVLHDERTGAVYIPLQHLPQAKAAFEVHNSPLSENAAVGFEYGYDVQDPSRFVLWEAQYGDFINGAQVIVDQFVTSARATWGQTPSLVFLLPHGHEGQGPEHSSARPERFLQSAADINLRLVNCTTAAQYFHVLRRQAALLKSDPLPLIVLTPKSLLRHPLVMSPARQLAEGQFHPVIDDSEATQRAGDIRRVLLCSGKVYLDLLTSEHHTGHRDVAIGRVEQLYPFPGDEIERLLNGYPRLAEVVWVQEEPENMGAWESVGPQLLQILGGRLPLRYVGRDRSASPAEGSNAWHAANQQRLVERAFARPGELRDTREALSTHGAG